MKNIQRMNKNNSKQHRSRATLILIRMTLLVVVFLLLVPSFILAQETRPTVYIISIDGEITPAMAAFLENKLDAANEAGAEGILIDIRTLGGRVDSALDMRDAMIESRSPVAVYIGTRAISAGALISIASETIIMTPGSHIGSAQPIPDDPKTVAFVRGEFATTAERTGRDPQVAMAMVDIDIEIEGLVREGEILDLTANQASEFGYADHIVESREEALRVLGWDNATIIEEEPDFRYRIAQFLTSYEVASLLLSIGMIALLAEFYTQGFGISGIIGVACIVLYFSSGFIAGYTELWSVVIFFIGVVLVVIELTIPEFGIFGISGLIAMFIGIVFAAPDVRQGVFSLLIAIVVGIITIPILIKLFGKRKLFQRLVLANAETVDMGYVHRDVTLPETNLLGKTGTAVSTLRPSGKVLIDDKRLDAIAEGSFIASGEKVKVIQVVGSKIVVISDDDQKEEDET